MLNVGKIHFIGIGGIGISALAHWALHDEATVSGSDASDSALLEDLRSQGATLYIGHKAEQVGKEVELVLYTEAIDFKANPEFLRAKELGIPTMSYFQALGKISEGKKTIAVTGSHGKTTTTAMLGLALMEAGLDPTVIVGSKVREFAGRNIRFGQSDLLVVEACEYRRDFLTLKPFGMVNLNLDLDHTDYYKDEKDYVSAFSELAEKIPAEGFLVINGDDPNMPEVAKHCKGRVIKAGMAEAERWDMALQVLGSFNKLNALLAFLASESLGADNHEVRHSLRKFRGTWRRMEVKGEFQGAKVYDDYGHHPTEVSATLKALKTAHPDQRLICVFQPHQYSRTFQLLEQFKTAFGSADLVIIPNIYAARDSDEDKKRIDAERLTKAIGEHHKHVVWGKDFDKTFDLLKKEVTEKDVVVTMGAGNITELGDRLARG
jgi:UDP-N-acetylmuramate--alanine ligase